MTKLKYTKHGEQRANQRGFRRTDVEIIRHWGTVIPDQKAEVYFLRKKDVERAISVQKQEIQRLERLNGCEVVIIDNQLVTVYQTSRRHEKTLLRRAG